MIFATPHDLAAGMRASTAAARGRRPALAALLLGACALSGCVHAAGSAAVSMVDSSAPGKGVFMISPRADKNCTLTVNAGEQAKQVVCTSDYLIGCDVAVGNDQPFCHLVREVGVDRESAYPQGRR